MVGLNKWIFTEGFKSPVNLPPNMSPSLGRRLGVNLCREGDTRTTGEEVSEKGVRGGEKNRRENNEEFKEKNNRIE